MHELVDGLARLGHADEFSDLVVAQVVEALPRNVLLLDLFDDLIWDFLKLTQWVHALPPRIDEENLVFRMVLYVMCKNPIFVFFFLSLLKNAKNDERFFPFDTTKKVTLPNLLKVHQSTKEL